MTKAKQARRLENLRNVFTVGTAPTKPEIHVQAIAPQKESIMNSKQLTVAQYAALSGLGPNEMVLGGPQAPSTIPIMPPMCYTMKEGGDG